MRGYAGKFSEIDLSAGDVKDIRFSEDALRKYLGGRGLATKILWDDFGPEQEPITAGLRAAGIRSYAAATVFPDFSPETHYLPHYSHPNAHANRELAAFLAAHLVAP